MKEDVMTASDILDELKKLIEQEKAEGEPDAMKHAAMLDSAVVSLEKFIQGETAEADEKFMEFSSGEEKPALPKPVVDTSSLTGPLPALKSLLIKTQRDNDSQQ